VSALRAQLRGAPAPSPARVGKAWRIAPLGLCHGAHSSRPAGQPGSRASGGLLGSAVPPSRALLSGFARRPANDREYGPPLVWLSRLLNAPLPLLADRQAKPTGRPSSRRGRPFGLIPALAAFSPKGGGRSPGISGHGLVAYCKAPPRPRREEENRENCTPESTTTRAFSPGPVWVEARSACGGLGLARPSGVPGQDSVSLHRGARRRGRLPLYNPYAARLCGCLRSTPEGSYLVLPSSFGASFTSPYLPGGTLALRLTA